MFMIFPSKWSDKAKAVPVLKHFWDKSFFHYTWISAIYSALNIFLLWLFIDIFKISTVLSSTMVIGGTFILRYLLFRWIKIV